MCNDNDTPKLIQMAQTIEADAIAKNDEILTDTVKYLALELAKERIAKSN
jgi:hypothetical protein